MEFNLLENKRLASRIYYSNNKKRILDNDKKRKIKLKEKGVPLLTDAQKEYKKNWGIEYRKRNKEKLYLMAKKYKQDNKEYFAHKALINYRKKKSENDELFFKRKNEVKLAYREKHKDAINKKAKEFYINNKDLINEKRRLIYSLNKDKKKIVLSEEQRIRKNKSNCDYVKNKRINGMISEFDKFKQSVRKRTHYAFNRLKINKPYNTEILLGINMYDLKVYIESMFKEGMNWENRKDWHVDHIIPLSSAKTKEDMIKLCNYKNLQPLWAKENMSKGAKILIIKNTENEY